MPSRNLKLFVLPALAGALWLCAFPRINQDYLAWVALSPLIWFVSRSASRKQAILGGLFSGVVAWFGLLVWIPGVLVHYGGVPEVLAWFFYSLLVCFLSCGPGLVCLITRSAMEYGGERFLLIFPFAWVSLDYLRNYVPFGGFPWLQAGYSQSGFLRLIQIADVAGVHGVSFILVWINTALVWLALRRSKAGRIWPAAFGLALIAASLSYGQAMLGKWRNTVPPYTAAMLQGNLSFNEPEAVLSRKFQEGYAKMASSLRPGSVNLMILPESPSPLIYQYDAAYRKALGELARHFSLGLVFNNISYEEVEGKAKYFNSAYFLGPNGHELGRYDKIHLVPFGEYVPLKKLFFFVDTISKDVSDFSPGRRYLTVEMGEYKVNVIICFEAIFSGLERRFVTQGSELIINLTNDNWYGNSAAPYQHLEMARWRAIENRRYLLRAANSGVSAIVDPTGAIQTSTPLLQEAICEGRFAFLRSLTFYTRYGDMFAILCVIIVVGLSAYTHQPALRRVLMATFYGGPHARGTARKN